MEKSPTVNLESETKYTENRRKGQPIFCDERMVMELKSCL